MWPWLEETCCSLNMLHLHRNVFMRVKNGAFFSTPTNRETVRMWALLSQGETTLPENITVFKMSDSPDSRRKCWCFTFLQVTGTFNSYVIWLSRQEVTARRWNVRPLSVFSDVYGRYPAVMVVINWIFLSRLCGNKPKLFEDIFLPWKLDILDETSGHFLPGRTGYIWRLLHRFLMKTTVHSQRLWFDWIQTSGELLSYWFESFDAENIPEEIETEAVFTSTTTSQKQITTKITQYLLVSSSRGAKSQRDLFRSFLEPSCSRTDELILQQFWLMKFTSAQIHNQLHSFIGRIEAHTQQLSV